MSEIEQGLIRQAKMAGEKIPEVISNKPVLAKSNSFYFNAFCDLDTERSHGMGLVRIPRSVIIAYAKECGLNEEEKYELIHIVRKTDDAHLEDLAKKRKNANAS